MNPKPGWVMNMANVFDMLSRVDFLDEFRANERKKAAEMLQNEVCAFVAHYGYVCTERCTATLHTYVLTRDGLVRRMQNDEDEEYEEVEVENLSLVEMEFLHEFIVDTLNNDIQYQEDEIDRYIDLCK